MRQYNDTYELELAWAAGFFDGEGSTNISKTKTGWYLRISIVQNDREVLDRFHKAIGGLGKVTGPNQYSYNKNPWYRYSLVGSKAHAALGLLFPYLSSIKRAQALAVIEKIKKNAPMVYAGSNEKRINEANEFIERWET